MTVSSWMDPGNPGNPGNPSDYFTASHVRRSTFQVQIEEHEIFAIYRGRGAPATYHEEPGATRYRRAMTDATGRTRTEALGGAMA